MQKLRWGSSTALALCLALLVTRPSREPVPGSSTAPPLAPLCTAAVVSSMPGRHTGPLWVVQRVALLPLPPRVALLRVAPPLPPLLRVALLVVGWAAAAAGVAVLSLGLPPPGGTGSLPWPRGLPPVLPALPVVAVAVVVVVVLLLLLAAPAPPAAPALTTLARVPAVTQGPSPPRGLNTG